MWMGTSYTVVTTISVVQKFIKIKLVSTHCLKRPLKNRQSKDLNDKWLLNEGQKCCRIFPFECSAVLLTCVKR